MISIKQALTELSAEDIASTSGDWVVNGVRDDFAKTYKFAGSPLNAPEYLPRGSSIEELAPMLSREPDQDWQALIQAQRLAFWEELFTVISCDGQHSLKLPRKVAMAYAADGPFGHAWNVYRTGGSPIPLTTFDLKAA